MAVPPRGKMSVFDVLINTVCVKGTNTSKQFPILFIGSPFDFLPMASQTKGHASIPRYHHKPLFSFAFLLHNWAQPAFIMAARGSAQKSDASWARRKDVLTKSALERLGSTSSVMPGLRPAGNSALASSITKGPFLMPCMVINKRQ